MIKFFTKVSVVASAALLTVLGAQAQTINTQSLNMVDPSTGKVASVGIGTLLANVNITLPQNGGQLITGPSGGLGFSQATRTNSVGQLESFAIPDGQLYVGNSTGGPSSKSIAGTPDQVIVTQSAGSISFELPQPIAVTSKPQFGGMGAAPSPLSGGSPTVPSGSVGFYDDDVTNITSLKAKSNVSSNVTYTLPGAPPSVSGAMMIAGVPSAGESSMEWSSFGITNSGINASADFNLNVGGANKIVTDGAFQASGPVSATKGYLYRQRKRL